MTVRSFAAAASLAAGAEAQTPPAADATVDACGHALRVAPDGDGLAVTGAAAPLRLPGTAAALERVPRPGGVAVIVRTRTNELPAAAALLSCAPGRAPAVVWQGSTRWRGEDVGDRARDDVAVVTLDGVRDVVVGTRRESPPLCGAPPVLTAARRLDPAGTGLVPVALDPAAELTAAAVTLRAEPVAPGPAAFVPRVARASGGDPRALFDGSPATVWEAPAGFVTVPLPSASLPLRAVELTPAPGRRGGSLTLLVAPGPRRYELALPLALPAAGAWRVTLPEALPARCVSLVARGVALAAVALRTPLDDGPAALRDLALAAGREGGDDAARLLVDLGPAGVSALTEALSTMPPAGARRALRLLAPAPGEAVSLALVRALAREELADVAVAALRRRGPSALDALATATATDGRAAVLAAAAGGPAEPRLRALAPALGAAAEPWSAARGALRAVLLDARREGVIEGWLAALPGDATARARALRVAAEVVADDPALAARAATLARALWAEGGRDAETDFAVRHRLLGVLAGDDAGGAIVVGVLARDPDADLRAEAARALAHRPDATAALVAALADPTPRVRASAASSLTARPAAREALAAALAHDRWPAVQSAAALALARDGAAAGPLLAALDAAAMVTVRAVLSALATNPGEGIATGLVAFVDDGRRNPRLRREAVESLGARCDRAAAGDLERVAAGLTDPALPPWEQAVGHAALAALARVDPARARAFLARSEANAEARSSVERAARQGCVPP